MATPDVPPWKPIADWLARLPQTPDDEAQDERLPQSATQHEIRKRYETKAKAIAYDLAVEGMKTCSCGTNEACDECGGNR